jgi:hypothetical protein
MNNLLFFGTLTGPDINVTILIKRNWCLLPIDKYGERSMLILL